MHADGMALAADSTAMLEPDTTARLPLRQRDRVFWLGLMLAFTVHALAIAAMIGIRQNHRTVGAPEGASDAIAVEIVDGATLKDSMEPPTPPMPPPGQQPQQTATVQAPPPQPEAQPAPPEPPAPEQPQAEAQPDPPPPEPRSQPPQAEAPPEPAPPQPAAPEATKSETKEEAAAPALEAMKEAPVAEKPIEAAQPPKVEPPPVKQEPPKKEAAKQQQPSKQQAAPKKRQRTSALDLSVPYSGSSSSDDAGASSAVQRPPGITKSGENDEFARNVIRALQRSMPRENARGRVTVRIVLNQSGSRADVSLLKSGGDPDLDFNVMFAARQTSFPFPPKGATVADRTFMVTYIYR